MAVVCAFVRTTAVSIECNGLSARLAICLRHDLVICSLLHDSMRVAAVPDVWYAIASHEPPLLLLLELGHVLAGVFAMGYVRDSLQALACGKVSSNVASCPKRSQFFAPYHPGIHAPTP